MATSDKYLPALKQILNAANKVRYLWETPEALEDAELPFTTIITKNRERVYLGIKKDKEGCLSLFYRMNGKKEGLLSIEQFSEGMSLRYPLIKPYHLKQDFLTKIALPLKKYEILIADAKGKARKKLEALEAILS
jgi:hypothetical protein